MTPSTQSRTHSGHAHSHHHDSTYLVSANRNDAGVRITRIGLFVNLGMAIGKGIGGYYFHSQALVADAFHSLTDLVSDFMTLATVSWSLKPPTTRFPAGYGKIESLGSLGVSGLLLVGGMLMGANACEVLYSQFFLEAAAEHAGHFGHGHSHTHADMGPNVNAAWLAAGSIIIKEYLYRATMKIARERRSSILASNAVHHRIDSLTSFVALAAIAGSHLFHDATWLDPIGGLIVSIMVIKAGWSNTYSALLELADVGVESGIKTSVRQYAKMALEARASQVKVRQVQGVKSGQNYLMEIQVAVPQDWSVALCHQAEADVRAMVGSKVRGVRRVKVRFIPKDGEDLDSSDEFIGPEITPRSSPEPEEEMGHHKEASKKTQ